MQLLKSIKSKLLRKKIVFPLIGALVLVSVAGYFFWGSSSSAAEYMTAKVEKGNLKNQVSATGTLQAVTTVQVGSQASGTISALYVDFNSTVKKGQVIAQLDPSSLQAQVDQSRANLNQVQAGLQVARANLVDAQARVSAAKSTAQGQSMGVSGAQANLAVLKAELDDAQSFLRQQESLAASGVVAQRDLDIAKTGYKTAQARYQQAQTQVDQARVSEQSSSGSGVQQAQAAVQQAQAQVLQSQAQVQQAEASLKQAELNMSHTTIVSPIDGVVVSRDVNVGQTVAASLSAPTLFTIANDLTQMQVIANIDQADIGMVEKAERAEFTVDAFPGDSFKGTIKQMRLNPQNVSNVVTYNVVIDVENPDQKLKPGMTTNLTFTIAERNNVLKVPNAALRFMPQDAQQRRSSGSGTGNGQGRGQRAQQQQQSNTDGNAGNADNAGNEQRQRANITPSSAAVMEGQTRIVWVMGQNSKPERRRIKIGISDGTSTEVLEGDLKEGDTIIIGQSVSGSTSGSGSSQGNRQTTAPGFGGGQNRGGGQRGGGR